MHRDDSSGFGRTSRAFGFCNKNQQGSACTTVRHIHDVSPQAPSANYRWNVHWRHKLHSLVTFARWGVGVFLAGFFSIVLWKFFTGSISLGYLLDTDIPDANTPEGSRSEPSAGRTQLLIVTLIVAAYYLAQVIERPAEFPHVPGKIVAALGASQALYLAAKARAMRNRR